MIPTDLLADIERAQDLVRILRRDVPVGYDYYVNVGRIFSLTRALGVEARKGFPNDAELVNVLDLAHDKTWLVGKRRCENHDLVLSQLADDLEVARARVRSIIRRMSLQYANELNRQRSAGDRKAFDHNLSGTAKALSKVAVRALPADYRQRYADEYRSELFDLQQSSRWRQFAYALRLILRTPLLRRELHGHVESERHDQLAGRRPYWVRSRR